MAGRRRSSDLDMNFDGLTDSVTNLVGALVLLVILVIGVTREAVSQNADRPQPESTGLPDAGERSIDELRRHVVLLEGRVRGVDAEINQLADRLRGLQGEAEALLRKVEEIQPPKDEPPEEPVAHVTKKVRYRKPFRRFDERNPVIFVLSNRRITFMDIDEISRRVFGEWIPAAEKASPHVVNESLPGGQLEINGVLVKGQPSFSLTVSSVQGARGDSVAEFQRRLRTFNSAERTVKFDVYPDSFDMYPNLREMAWDLGFAVGWAAMQPAEKLRIVRGSGGSMVD